MIGKIVKGTSFSGCVNYVLKEDKSRLLKAVGVYGSPEEIAEQFELQKVLYFNNLFYINDLYMYMCLSRDKLGTKIGVKNAKKNKYRH